MADLDRARTASSTTASSGASTAKPWLCAVISTLPVRAVLHRLVDAAVAVAELVGAEAERAAEHLVAEADAEERHAARRSTARTRLDRVRRRSPGRPGRWRRTPRRRRPRARSSAVDVAGSTCTSMPRSAIRCGVIALMPRSSAATVNRCSPDRRHDVRLGGRDLGGQVGARHRRATRAPARAAPPASVSTRRDADPHRAALAQVPGQRAGVDAADADDALRGELVVEACAAPASSTARRRGVAHDVAGDPDPRATPGPRR